MLPLDRMRFEWTYSHNHDQSEMFVAGYFVGSGTGLKLTEGHYSMFVAIKALANNLTWTRLLPPPLVLARLAKKRSTGGNGWLVSFGYAMHLTHAQAVDKGCPVPVPKATANRIRTQSGAADWTQFCLVLQKGPAGGKRLQQNGQKDAKGRTYSFSLHGAGFKRAPNRTEIIDTMVQYAHAASKKPAPPTYQPS
jgi:hypothetical protein